VWPHNADGECLQASTRADKLCEETIVVGHRRPRRPQAGLRKEE
jgi:hypothetical protein